MSVMTLLIDAATATGPSLHSTHILLGSCSRPQVYGDERLTVPAFGEREVTLAEETDNTQVLETARWSPG